MVQKIYRMERLHHLIRRKQTGSSDVLAKRLGLSRSTLYYLLADLRALGAPIVYCRERSTFYYQYEVEFKIGFERVENLGKT